MKATIIDAIPVTSPATIFDEFDNSRLSGLTWYKYSYNGIGGYFMRLTGTDYFLSVVGKTVGSGRLDSDWARRAFFLGPADNISVTLSN